MDKSRYILLLCLLSASLLRGQEVTPTFAFADGLYFTYDEFVRNQPRIPMQDVQPRLVTNPRTWITQVESLTRRSDGQPVDINQLWGISIDGIPYIRIAADSIDKPLPAFAGLRITGNICYFQYERTEERLVEMTAYNPLTGRPFRSGQVKRDYMEIRERILRFETGGIPHYNQATTIQCKTRHQMIQTTLRRLSPDTENLEDQLYNIMLSFNKRHPVFIKE